MEDMSALAVLDPTNRFDTVSLIDLEPDLRGLFVAGFRREIAGMLSGCST